MEPIALQPADRAILALEGPTVAGHTCKVVMLGPDAPDAAALREAIAARIEAAPELTWRLGGSDAEPTWVEDPAFDVADHVGSAPGRGSVDRADLGAVVADLFEQRLDRSRPLWRIDRVGLADGGAALVWRIHHALADGFASMRLSRAVLWDRTEGETAPSGHQAAWEHDHARRRHHLAGFLEREFSESRRGSPFDGKIGTRREVAFAVAPLHELHDAAKAIDGATLNDAVLTVVAGGLRRWIEHHHGRLGSVRVRVPVSLHHEGDSAGNHDSFFSVALPLNEPDPVARLRAVHKATTVRKAAHDAEEMDDLLRELGGVSTRLERFCVKLEDSPRRFAVSVSNVPGPRTPVAVLGAPVTALHSIAEIGEHHALRVSVISMGDSLCFGFCADPAIVHDIQVMADGAETEARALLAAAG